MPISGYAGPVGVAWAAGAVARRLGSDEAAGIAARTLKTLAEGRPELTETDYLTGISGAAQALLALASASFADAAHPLLAQIAARLKATAKGSGNTRFWRAGGTRRGGPGLTGLSHGAAGHAVALAGLGRNLQDEACIALATAALRHERRYYDDAQCNWQDLRFATPGGAPSFGHYWCHGAPGIGLARALMTPHMAAIELEEDRMAATRTTAALVSRMAAAPAEAHCLCHGLPGNALTLARMSKGNSGCATVRSALDVARDAMLLAYGTEDACYRRSPLDSGTPGMMLGLGGVVYYFLFSAGETSANLLDLSLA